MATRKNIKRGVRKGKEGGSVVHPFHQKTPRDRAAFELYTSLTKDYGKSSREAEALSRETMRLDTFTTMNIPVLAASLLILERYGAHTEEAFTVENLKEYIDQLMRNVIPPDGNDINLVQEYNKTRYSYMESILRYVLKIIATRNEMTAQYQEEKAAIPIEEERKEEEEVPLTFTETTTFIDADEV